MPADHNSKTPSIAARHSEDIQKGERFEFGKNWRRFLSTLNDERIALAEQSLKKFLSVERLDGKTFLDIGSGSGLFSWVARRLGAKVHSFDYDPQSVACTNELRHRYFPNDENWLIEQGSVLDREYLASLGTFDIVYSWGVLHHTGAMWDALANIKPLVRPQGQLFIAIYNDLGAVTDGWRKTKRTYNRLPSALRLPFALWIIARDEVPSILSHLRRGDLQTYLRIWTDYSKATTRGMSRWHDWIDWIGGYPYECTSVEEIVDFFGKDGFALERLESRALGTGCNEFVFRRKADLGFFIDNPVPKSRWILRQFGRRLTGPFRQSRAGYIGVILPALRGIEAGSLVLFRDGELVGTANRGDEPDTIVVAPPEWPGDKVKSARFELIHGELRLITQQLRYYSGHMYGASFPELAHIADNTSSSGDVSPVFIFEDVQQLSYPHSLHADIVRHGAGRFSHWGQEVLFSSSDNSDPRSNERTYSLLIARTDGPPLRSGSATSSTHQACEKSSDRG